MRLYEILEARSNVPVDDAFAVLFAGKHKTSEISGVPPVSFTSKGGVLEDYLISGNTIQNGTPTPEAPVDVVGCGVWDETQQSYKLPIAVNGTEHPIYLGQVPTTRRIRKLVLDGEEKWMEVTGKKYWIEATNYQKSGLITKCTHYIGANNGNGSSVFTNGTIGFYSSAANRLMICDTSQSDVESFKQFLAAQYANGTPVMIWYVLAESETAVVNEPLMKIGDYADTVSMVQAGVTIPTVAGANTLTIDTAVQPSSVTIRGRIRPTL